MLLKQPITIYPPPVTDNNGRLLEPPALGLHYLEVTYHDNPTAKAIYVSIRNIPGSLFLYRDQEYDSLGDYNKKDLQAKLEKVLGDDPATVIRSMFPKTLEEHPNGPGTILSKMISKIGIKSTPNCSCRRHAIEMNERGNDWCEENISTILGWLKDESQKRNLPFVETVAKLLVKRAIAKSRNLLGKANV